MRKMYKEGAAKANSMKILTLRGEKECYSPLGNDGSGATARDDSQEVVPSTLDAAGVSLNQLLQGDRHALLHGAGIVDVAWKKNK